MKGIAPDSVLQRLEQRAPTRAGERPSATPEHPGPAPEQPSKASAQRGRGPALPAQRPGARIRELGRFVHELVALFRVLWGPCVALLAGLAAGLRLGRPIGAVGTLVVHVSAGLALEAAWLCGLGGWVYWSIVPRLVGPIERAVSTVSGPALHHGFLHVDVYLWLSQGLWGVFVLAFHALRRCRALWTACVGAACLAVQVSLATNVVGKTMYGLGWSPWWWHAEAAAAAAAWGLVVALVARVWWRWGDSRDSRTCGGARGKR